VTQIKYKYVGVYPYASQLNVCNSLGENWMPLIVPKYINTDIATRFFFSPLARYLGKNLLGGIVLSFKRTEALPSGCENWGSGLTGHPYLYVSPSNVMTGHLSTTDFKFELDGCDRVEATFCALLPKN